MKDENYMETTAKLEMVVTQTHKMYTTNGIIFENILSL